ERQKILENSTMDGSVKASLLSGTMTTLGDDMVVTSVSGELTLNGKAKVVHKDVQCVNGLMHVIDNLLN
ncbi:MAG: putative surface protein with fasciclin (FAS1) repeats, partial [Bacteroidia bacterium]